MKLPVVALRDMTVLPGMLMHFDVSREKSISAAEYAMNEDRQIFLTCQKDENTEDPEEDDLFRTGTVGTVQQIMKLPDGIIRVLVKGKERAILKNLTALEPCLMGEVELMPCCRDVVEEEQEAMIRTLKDGIREYTQLNRAFGEGAVKSLLTYQTLEGLIMELMIRLPMSNDQRQALLEQDSTCGRFYMLSGFMQTEGEILQLRREIQDRVKERVDQNQKEYVLREQMKVIHEELGDDGASDIRHYEEALDKLKAGQEVKDKIRKEIHRLSAMPNGSQEGTVSRTYIETLLELPWQKLSRENRDIKKAEKILNEDHYGMEKIKERILEYLAVRHFTGEAGGSILCLVGPPGTGKTSIARSVARALDKKYVRVCLGGVHDEAEIRGHRRTYIGAMPGRIVTGLKQAGVGNPLMLLDEVDKVSNDYHGDTFSALLEVLDSEQNSHFRDHYVELPIDLSRVFFIATANTLDTIPRPLLDRMEVIEVGSYTENEKYYIAEDYLLEKQRKKNGLKEGMLSISEAAMRKIIHNYTREAGVRGLERRIGEICRKTARELLEQNRTQVKITAGNLVKYLGKEKIQFDAANEDDQVGIVRGLAWTSVGGDTLEIEVNTMPGEGKIQLTGQLGDVMKESAQAGISYIRSVGSEYGVPEDYFEKHDVHLHIPEGAVPKDGPSAGITMAVAVLSAATNRKIRADLAMTGEITLRGRVLPIGGLKEKLLAAQMAGIHLVLVPEKNRRDVEELSSEITKGMEIVFVSHMDEVLKRSLL